jgi:hypothetical protein
MLKEKQMKSTDIYRESVLEKIACGKGYMKVGKVTYKINGKLYHVRVKTGQLTKYPFNINNATLAADFEVYVCGTDKLYYVIPVELVKRMHSDPSAMPDYTHPGLTVIDVHPSKEIIVYGTGGKSIKVNEYKNLTA